MAFLLYHDTTTHGMIATPSRVGNVPHPPRRYEHDGHFLVVDGPEEDVQEILKIAGYRIATSQEQERYHAAKRQASVIHEAPTPAENHAEEQHIEVREETKEEEHAEAVEERHTDAPARRGRRDK